MVSSVMSRFISRDAQNGRFTLGRGSAEKFSAVEGLRHTEKTGRLVTEAEKNRLTGEARRARIRAEFAKK